MLYAALLLPMVLMVSLFVMSRLESWLSRELGLRQHPTPAAARTAAGSAAARPSTALDIRRN